MNQLSIVITGGGSGIGRALARGLARDGHRIIICGRREDKLAETAGDEDNIQWYGCDVSKEESVGAFKKFVSEKFDELEVLINNAGGFGGIGPFYQVDPDSWRSAFESNTFGPFLVTRAMLDLLRKGKEKKIINLAGGGAFNPMSHYSAYAVSKAGIVRLSENMAVELADEGFMVNCLAPGFVSTEMHQDTLAAGADLAGEQYSQTRRRYIEDDPALGRALDCVRFLLSPEVSGLSGKTISAGFDPWDIEGFFSLVPAITDSDLYTGRRINIDNLAPGPLREQLSRLQTIKHGNKS